MSESQEIKVGDWVQFKMSGFKNEGRITKDGGDSFQIEVPTDGTSIYVDVPKGPKVKKIDAPSGG